MTETYSHLLLSFFNMLPCDSRCVFFVNLNMRITNTNRIVTRVLRLKWLTASCRDDDERRRIPSFSLLALLALGCNLARAFHFPRVVLS